MRKIFASAMGLALIGATLFGAVYAWSAGGSDSDSATVGTVSVNVVVTPNAAVLGPDNGIPVNVGSVAVTNTGSIPAVAFTGTVSIDSVTQVPGGGTCVAGHFTGSPVAGPVNGADNILIATNVGAPNDCQGDTVNYTVIVTATT